MQNQSWAPMSNYFTLIQCSQQDTTLLCQPPIQFYPLMYDFSGYDFKIIQLQNLSPSPIAQPVHQNIEIAQDSYVGEAISVAQVKDEENYKDKDRNIVSNSLKVFRKFVSDSAKLENSVVQSIIETNRLNYTVEEFLKDLEKKIPRERNYFGIKFLKCLLNSKDKKTNFVTVIRVLLNYFYKKQVYTTVLTSWKILSPAKKKQIAGTRRIRHLL